MNQKLQSVLISLLAASAASGLIFGITYILTYFNETTLKSVEECKQLEGVLKDNPEMELYLKYYPEKVNQLRSDNCLEGREKIVSGYNTLRIIGPILCFGTSFWMTLRLLWPDKEILNK